MTTTTNQTALLPVDPAVSPQQISRIVPIRANLLPTEITSHRNARNIRIILVGVTILVVILVGLWYLYAVGQKSAADDAQAEAAAQVRSAQQSLKLHQELINTLDQQKTIDGQLTTLLTNDLPWATTLDTLRSTASKVGANVTTISGVPAVAGTTAAGSAAVVAVTVGGTAKDKNVVADYVDALAGLPGMANPYLTVATEDEDGEVTFSLNVAITTKALCGRFTTDCKPGGN